MVTVGHCSKRLGVQDHTNYYQPASKWNGVSQATFAQEVFDPKFEPCDTIFCRGSDALIASTTQSVSSRIARPYGPPGGIVSWGSTTIDPSNPFLTVTDLDDPVLNEPIEKVGIYTGWTEGIVHSTCEIEYIETIPTESGRAPTCQSKGSYGSHGGDSGAPVFRYNPATGMAVLVGIHWGHQTAGGAYADGLFSRMSQVESDLGYLYISP